MGLATGTVSVTRYKMLGDAKNPSIQQLNDLLDGHRAAPFKLTGVAKTEYYGWVKPLVSLSHDTDSEDSYWDMSDGRYEDGFFLRLRVEKRRVPSTVLQLVYKQKLAAEQEGSDKALTKTQKKTLRDKVTRDLLGKCLPQIGYIDGFWRDTTGELLVFTTGKGALKTFTRAFHDTFADELDLHPVPLTPPVLGLLSDDWPESDKLAAHLDKLALTLPVAGAGSQMAAH